MALNFPDPATQTPVNTWSPTSTPSASTNGLTYLWDGTKWTTQATAPEPYGAFQPNKMVVTADFTLQAGDSALSAGPITIQNGVTVTIPNNQNWVVL